MVTTKLMVKIKQQMHYKELNRSGIGRVVGGTFCMYVSK